MCPGTAAQYNHVLRQAITLVCAISICMTAVVCLVRVLEPSKSDRMQQPYVRYPVEYGTEPVLLMNSFANAFSFLSMIMIVNCTLVLLYKGGFTNVIKAWLMTGSGVLLFVVTYYYLGRCVFYFNFPMDHFTCSFVVWNIGMTGMAALYFHGPFVLHQSFVVYVSALMAVVLEETFPEWTTWILLVLVSLWDIFAVLCVIGPLRMLIETANERNEPLFPALLFSTSSAWCCDLSGAANRCSESSPNASAATCSGGPHIRGSHEASPEGRERRINSVLRAATPDPAQGPPGTGPTMQEPTDAEELPYGALNFRGSTNSEDSFAVAHMESIQERRHQEAVRNYWCAYRHRHHAHHSHRHRRSQATAPQDKGMKMGLGDFVFYSILVGKASRHGTVSAAVACYVFVIIGILSTLALLVIVQKPMPALPLSIGLGMFAYFSTIYLVEPFLEEIGFVTL